MEQYQTNIIQLEFIFDGYIAIFIASQTYTKVLPLYIFFFFRNEVISAKTAIFFALKIFSLQKLVPLFDY